MNILSWKTELGSNFSLPLDSAILSDDDEDTKEDVNPVLTAEDPDFTPNESILSADQLSNGKK
jgi:hypothetical protein